MPSTTSLAWRSPPRPGEVRPELDGLLGALGVFGQRLARGGGRILAGASKLVTIFE
jgi:hypothetical protein